MGYDSDLVISNLVKRDGTTLGSTDLLQYIATKGDTFSGPFAYSNYLNTTVQTITTDRLASALFVGIDIVNGQVYPKIFEVDPTKLVSMMATKRYAYKSSYPNGEVANNLSYPLTYSTTNPNMLVAGSFVQSQYRGNSSKVHEEGLEFSFSELTSLNAGMKPTLANPYGGASVTQISTPVSSLYWTNMEEQTVGFSNINTTTSPFNKLGVHQLTYLFYTLSLIDELQFRYGYKVPHKDIYNPSNWIRASTAGSTGSIGDPSTYRYYKLLYLTETDFLQHSNAFDNPALLNEQNIIYKPASGSSAVQKVISDLMYSSGIKYFPYYGLTA